jgi:hypothetical protein
VAVFGFCGFFLSFIITNPCSCGFFILYYNELKVSYANPCSCGFFLSFIITKRTSATLILVVAVILIKQMAHNCGYPLRGGFSIQLTGFGKSCTKLVNHMAHN